MSDVQAPVRSPHRRHLVVLAIAVVGLIVGVTLVVTGRRSPSVTVSSTTPPTVAPEPLLPSLGATTDESAAKALIATLDPATLGLDAPGADGSTTTAPTGPRGVQLTATGLQRCQQAITQQNTDRSLGSRLAAGWLRFGGDVGFVVSYALPASGTSPAGERIVLVDARTCRVLGAVDHARSVG